MSLDPTAALELAHEAFAELLSGDLATHWTAQSTCSEWSVGDLVDHVIGGNAFTIEILGGATASSAWRAALGVAEAGTARRAGAYLDTAEEMLKLIRAAGDATRTYHHVAGEVPLAVVATLRTNDLLLHTWDLSTSIDRDTELDAELVEFVWANMSPHAEDLADSGQFGAGASGRVGAKAATLDRLLDLTGRRRA